MSVATILGFLKGALARHGAEIVSVVDLAAIGAVERHLESASVADPDARAVAWTASLAPHADREAFRQTFGVVAAALLERLVPPQALRPQPSFLGRMNLQSAWARATKDSDAVVRTVATALLAAEAEKIGRAEDRDVLRRIVEIALRETRDEATKAALTEIHDGLAALTATQEESGDAGPVRPLLISLSIDVVGSTEAKRRLRDLAGDDAWRVKLYQQFYANFLHEEDRFYSALFAPGIWGSGPPLDWRRLFVVKGIGDELWLTYEITQRPGEDAGAAPRQAAVRLVTAALSLARSEIQCGGTGEDLGPDFDSEVEARQRVDLMHLPFKISMDLIEDAVEISAQRLDFLAPRAGSYLAPRADADGLRNSEPFGAQHVDILRRLNAGHFELVGGHRLRQAYRTDYVGPDVDRFFRITKFALPGIVMVGDNLMRRLSALTLKQLTPEVDLISLQFPPDLHHPESEVAGCETLRRHRPVAGNEMKGVDAPYTVHYLIEQPSLRDIWRRAEVNPFLAPTVKEWPVTLREMISPKHAAGEQTDADPPATPAIE